MEPMMKEGEKRQVAIFYPYKRTADGIMLFLQKRTADAERSPGVFGAFGGGLDEGETPEQGLLREVREELTYTPARLTYFSRYETADKIGYIYLEEVGDDFESKIEVKEGEFGQFLTFAQISEVELSPTSRLVTRELSEKLK